MPIPNSPPYGNNTLPPRQLNRWLDVNAQNGPLSRTRGYVSLPLNSIGEIVGPQLNDISVTKNSGDFTTFNLYDSSFNLLDSKECNAHSTVTFTGINYAYAIQDEGQPGFFILPSIGWAGSVSIDDFGTWTYTTSQPVSDKFLQFNYHSTRNFSLKNDSYLRNLRDLYDGKAVICLTYIDAHTPFNIVKRYALTAFNKEDINAIPYTGQKIKGYFQIEFWSRTDFSLTLEPLSAPLLLYTSLLGDIDYRFGEDFSLGVSTTVTDFQNNNPDVVNTFNLPLTFNANNVSGLN